MKPWHDDTLNACVRTAVISFDELIPKYRADVRSEPLYDKGDDATGAQLIGKGKKLKDDAFTDARQPVSQYLQRIRMGLHHWVNMPPGATGQPLELCSFALAPKHGDELIWSVAHRRSKSR